MSFASTYAQFVVTFLDIGNLEMVGADGRYYIRLSNSGIQVGKFFLQALFEWLDVQANVADR